MRTIAFYLPQFHTIPENDEWWGEGFTEWTNVRRAAPQFEGHQHPRLAGELGEYDLSDPDVYRRQSELARTAGVDAFCMYFYWFDGRRLLERPVEAWRQDDQLLPYCLSWANESWTRRWDGKERDVLMPQSYAEGFDDQIFDDLLPHFRAPHYLTQDGRPVFLVHRVELVPEPKKFAQKFRDKAMAAGLPGLYLVAAETTPGIQPSAFGFDAVAEFPPVGANTLATAQLRPLSGVSSEFRGRLMSYPRMVKRFLARRDPEFVRHAGVAPGWDNTARRRSSATVYVGASPSRYAAWLAAAHEREERRRGPRGLVFVNAWNEWAEGAYLEPDGLHGSSYIEATRNPRSFRGGHDDGITYARMWSLPQVRSIALAAAGSVLSVYRRVRNVLRGRSAGKG